MVRKTSAPRTEKPDQKTMKQKSLSDRRIASRAKKITEKKSGIPVEIHRAERQHPREDDEGDLDQETLERSAPFNRTYGLLDAADEATDATAE